jgi:hypothetical protein
MQSLNHQQIPQIFSAEQIASVKNMFPVPQMFLVPMEYVNHSFS